MRGAFINYDATFDEVVFRFACGFAGHQGACLTNAVAGIKSLSTRARDGSEPSHLMARILCRRKRRAVRHRFPDMSESTLESFHEVAL